MTKKIYLAQHVTTACALFGVAVFLCSALSGCAEGPPPRAFVHGTVEINGERVTGGEIKLKYEAQDTVVTIPINGWGSFSMGNIPAGNARVAVDTKMVKKMKAPKARGGNDKEPPPPVYVEIPAKYASFEESGITWNLHAGQQRKDIELTK